MSSAGKCDLSLCGIVWLPIGVDPKSFILNMNLMKQGETVNECTPKEQAGGKGKGEKTGGEKIFCKEQKKPGGWGRRWPGDAGERQNCCDPLLLCAQPAAGARLSPVGWCGCRRKADI